MQWHSIVCANGFAPAGPERDDMIELMRISNPEAPIETCLFWKPGPMQPGQFNVNDFRNWLGATIIETPTEQLIKYVNWVNKGSVRVAPSFMGETAGNGLFADRDFKAFETVTVYGGRLMQTAEFEALSRKQGELNFYGITIDRQLIMSGLAGFAMAQPGRWANGLPWDASNDPEQRRFFFNNAYYEWDPQTEQVLIVAALPIRKGEEIFCLYSSDYPWRAFYPANYNQLVFQGTPSSNIRNREAGEPRTLPADQGYIWDRLPLAQRRNAFANSYAEQYRVDIQLSTRAALNVLSELEVLMTYALRPFDADIIQILRQIQDPRQLVDRVVRMRKILEAENPSLVKRISEYSPSVQDLNTRLESIIFLANLIPGPVIGFDARLYADQVYTPKKPKSITMIVDGIRITEPLRNGIFVSVNVEDPNYQFQLKDKGIWAKDRGATPQERWMAANVSGLRKASKNLYEMILKPQALTVDVKRFSNPNPSAYPPTLRIEPGQELLYTSWKHENDFLAKYIRMKATPLF
jgi:hypothetical protein